MPNHSYGDLTQPSRPLDKDRLAMIPRHKAANAAHEALFPIQSKTPEEMVAGAAVLFATICDRCRLDPEEMVRIARRILRDPDGQLGGDKRNNDSLQSLRDFAGIRIMGERHVSIS